ncbi:MAG: hypothetical protein ACKORE_07880, partial [Bacteroidota bacterium]
MPLRQPFFVDERVVQVCTVLIGFWKNVKHMLGGLQLKSTLDVVKSKPFPMIRGLLILSLLSTFSIRAIAQSTPDWANDVSCILYSKCTSCHYPGGAAPFSLMTYAEASGAAAGIYSAVAANRMPPWPPDPAYRSFIHERSLSVTEKQTILDWINNGSPQGNPAQAPPPPVYTSAEVIQNPDLVSKMPVYTIPPIAYDIYRCFVMPTGNTLQQFITGMEVVPGNKSVVHHVLVFEDTTNTPLQLDAQDPNPGYVSFGGTGSNASKLLGAWVPGSSPDFYPAGTGIPLSPGANIIIQIHYPVGSSFQQDSTKVNFQLTADPNTRSVAVVPALNQGNLTNGPLFIPANTLRTFNAQQIIPAAVTLLGIAPHMHLIGRSVRSWAVTLVGDTIPLIDIPDWNFKWQGSYRFPQPVKIPAFSTLYSTATYDNTINNPYNPSIPPQNVSLGEATTDEMMLVFFAYLIYQPGDEFMAIDTITGAITYNGCNATTGAGELQNNEGLNVYPNPSSGAEVRISLPNRSYLLRLF